MQAKADWRKASDPSERARLIRATALEAGRSFRAWIGAQRLPLDA